MKRTFAIRDVAELLGTTPRRVEGWVERGLLKPIQPGRGPGTRRAFGLESAIAGMLLLKVQPVLGERNEHLRELVPVFTDVVSVLVTALSARLGEKPITLAVASHEEGHVKGWDLSYAAWLFFGQDRLGTTATEHPIREVGARVKVAARGG